MIKAKPAVKKTITRPFPLRLSLDVLDDMRAEGATVNWSMNQFGAEAIKAIVKMCRAPEGKPPVEPEMVQLIRLAKKLQS